VTREFSEIKHLCTNGRTVATYTVCYLRSGVTLMDGLATEPELCRRAYGDLRSQHFYPRDAMLARVLTMALCLSVCLCLSQLGVLSKRLNESVWFLATELLSTYHTFCYRPKEIQASTKKVLPTGTLLQTLDLENFATASSKRVINLAGERWTFRA